MTFNSQDIIHEIRVEFEKMLDFVTGEEARTATADRIERGLFKMLISLGAQLLTLFFVVRSQACSRASLALASGQELPYHRDTKRDYFSIFGKVAVWRPYFYKKEIGGQSPLDAELSLGEDCYSDLVREVSEYLGVYSVYHKTGDILERLLGLHLSTRVVDENVAEDAVDVEAYYAQKPPPSPAQEAEILVIQADGKGVPMVMETCLRVPVCVYLSACTHRQTHRQTPAEPKVRLGKGEKRGHKKEAVVTTVYTIAAAPRTPEEVVASFFDQNRGETTLQTASPRSKPQNKHVWATLAGKDTALSRLARQVAPRQGSHITDQVALCDGCEALQSRIAARFPGFAQVLDFIHADEYLWDVANRLLGETNEQRVGWMAEHALQMLSGQTAQVIAEFRLSADRQVGWPRIPRPPQPNAPNSSGQPTTLSLPGLSACVCLCVHADRYTHRQAADRRNLPYMDYPTYLAKGWPIASGVIEGACRHFVKDRCELSGMRWSQAGAENLLHLRAVAENDDWDAYHDFRRRQRHSRLYGLPFPDQKALERQALDKPIADRPPAASSFQTVPVFVSPDWVNCYELPLAA